MKGDSSADHEDAAQRAFGDSQADCRDSGLTRGFDQAKSHSCEAPENPARDRSGNALDYRPRGKTRREKATPQANDERRPRCPQMLVLHVAVPTSG